MKFSLHCTELWCNAPIILYQKTKMFNFKDQDYGSKEVVFYGLPSGWS